MPSDSLGCLMGTLANSHSAFAPDTKAEAAFGLVAMVRELEAENDKLKSEIHRLEQIALIRIESEI